MARECPTNRECTSTVFGGAWWTSVAVVVRAALVLINVPGGCVGNGEGSWKHLGRRFVFHVFEG